MKNGSTQKSSWNTDKSTSEGISLNAILDLLPNDKVIIFIILYHFDTQHQKVIFLLGIETQYQLYSTSSNLIFFTGFLLMADEN